MSGEQWGEAVDAVVRLFDSQEGSYLLTKNWIDVDDIRLAVATAAPLIVADTLKRDRERMTAALLHILAVSNPRDRWDEGYAAGIGEAMHWITPGATVTDEDFARGSGNGDSGQETT